MRLLLIFTLLCSLLGCTAEPEPLRIGSNRWPGYAPYFLADEQGWLAENNIHLIEYPHTTGVLRAFDNGLLDAAFLTLDEALRLAADGHDLQLLLVADVSAGADVLYARPQITTLGALAGQRIGVENTALGAYFLSRILDQAGLTEQQVVVVNLPVNEHGRAMQEGRIDAVVSFASEESGMRSAGAVRLLDSRALPDAIIDVLVVSRQRASPTRQARLQQLWHDSLSLWQHDRPRHDPSLARRLGMQSDDLQQTLAGLQLGDPQLNQQMFAGGRLQAQLEQLQAYLLQRGLLMRPPPHPLLGHCQGAAC